MPLKKLLQPAIDVAKHGFVVDQTYRDQTESNRTRLQAFTSSRALYLAAAASRPRSAASCATPTSRRRTSGSPTTAPRAFYGGPIGAAVAGTVAAPARGARLAARLPRHRRA